MLGKDEGRRPNSSLTRITGIMKALGASSNSYSPVHHAFSVPPLPCVATIACSLVLVRDAPR